MKKRLLFVTLGGEDSDNGFSYALELATTLNQGIIVLMVYGKRAIETYEDVMAAVAFAEAGDHIMVKELLQKQGKEIKEIEGRKVRELTRRCREASVDIICQTVSGDTIATIKDFLKDNAGIDMVLLSPNLLAKIDIKKLTKEITKPVVTISRAIIYNKNV